MIELVVIGLGVLAFILVMVDYFVKYCPNCDKYVIVEREYGVVDPILRPATSRYVLLRCKNCTCGIKTLE